MEIKKAEYEIIVRVHKDKFVLGIPSLCIVVEDVSLEHAYEKLYKEREILLKKLQDTDFGDWISESSTQKRNYFIDNVFKISNIIMAIIVCLFFISATVVTSLLAKNRQKYFEESIDYVFYKAQCELYDKMSLVIDRMNSIPDTETNIPIKQYLKLLQALKKPLYEKAVKENDEQGNTREKDNKFIIDK